MCIIVMLSNNKKYSKVGKSDCFYIVIEYFLVKMKVKVGEIPILGYLTP